MTVNDPRLVVQCNECLKKFSLKPELRGRLVKCPCGKQLRVPMQENDTQTAFAESSFTHPQLGVQARKTDVVNKPKKRTSREWATLIGGWACVAVVGLLFSLAIISFFIGGYEPRQPFALMIIASFPALLAVACLMPEYRHISVRMVGGIMCVVFMIAFFFALNDADANEHVRRKGIFIALAIAMGAVAIKGRWPFGDSKK